VEPLALLRPATQPVELCVDVGFINDDKAVQVVGHEGLAPGDPVQPLRLMLAALSLAGQQRFYGMARPFRRHRSMVSAC